jgi:hypothetical protein
VFNKSMLFSTKYSSWKNVLGKSDGALCIHLGFTICGLIAGEPEYVRLLDSIHAALILKDGHSPLKCFISYNGCRVYNSLFFLDHSITMAESALFRHIYRPSHSLAPFVVNMKTIHCTIQSFERSLSLSVPGLLSLTAVSLC